MEAIPIIITPITTTQPNQQVRWAFHKADWTKFASICKSDIDLNKITTAADPIQEISKGIIDAANQAIPKRRSGAQRISKPWFNKEVKDGIANRRRAYRRVKANPTTNNLQEYNITKAKTRNIIRQTERDSWAKFISKLNPRTSTRKIWETIHKISGKKRPSPDHTY